MTDFEKWLADLKPILDDVSATDLAELEWEKEGRRVKIVRKPVERRKESALPQKEKVQLISVRSPVVGTFHFFEAKSELGHPIGKGHPLGYIVSINVKHNVESETRGKLAEIHVEDGQAVEFGQLLFTLEPHV